MISNERQYLEANELSPAIKAVAGVLCDFAACCERQRRSKPAGIVAGVHDVSDRRP